MILCSIVCLLKLRGIGSVQFSHVDCCNNSLRILVFWMTNFFQRNPELGHILNDPEIIRQTMEMVRNPNMFQEMMRNHDQAIRNLQVFPIQKNCIFAVVFSVEKLRFYYLPKITVKLRL